MKTENEMKMKMKMMYESPRVNITQVVLEKNIAAGALCSPIDYPNFMMNDWVDGGEEEVEYELNF